MRYPKRNRREKIFGRHAETRKSKYGCSAARARLCRRHANLIY